MVNFIESIFERLFQGLKIRPVTRHLVERIFWDLPCENPERVDFGLDSVQHYRAIKAILLNGPEAVEAELDEATATEELRKRILALEDALGNGPKLNALVRRFAPEYAGKVHFFTSWDELYGRIDEPQEKK